MINEVKWQEHLNKLKAKSTEPRLKILLALESSKKPVSAEALITQTRLDKATVYRVLNFLKSKSIVRLIDLRQGKSLYELQLNNHHHHHIICTKCGTIESIDLCLFNNISADVLQCSGFAKISDHSMEFFGLCKKCSNN